MTFAVVSLLASWETRERVFVTGTDVTAVLERHRGREVAAEPEADAGPSEE